MKYGLIGEKLGHSYSKPIHEGLGRYEYEICPVAREDLSDFLLRRDFSGVNVTIPYKREVMAYCESVSEEAALCGAVNTLINRGGKLYGYNTDFMGMKALLSHAGIDVFGKKVLILGSGGTSGTALNLCRHLGAREVLRVSRSAKGDCISYDEAKAHIDAQIIINTTPCGMFPNAGETPLSLDPFPALCGVADAVYNPLRSALILEAQKRKIPAEGGLYMLVAQAVFAAGIWLDEDFSDRIEPLYKKILRQTENIVLIGMPGCGKSTVGKALAAQFGMDFHDSDQWIEHSAHRSIPTIFSEKGESFFRDLETEAVKALSSLRGCVIATGGGAVLREENVKELKMNGRLFFLDAPLADLVPTESRPLSSNCEDLKRRYEERYPVYRAVCDVRIPTVRQLAENLSEIEKELK